MSETIRKEIHEAYRFLRENNNSISDETLELMKTSSLNSISAKRCEVTNEMLYSAVKKAVQVGLLPKYSDENQYLRHYDMIKQVVNAALEQQ